ncbi:hypothetical protein D9M68_478710 [compost metagenome]
MFLFRQYAFNLLSSELFSIRRPVNDALNQAGEVNFICRKPLVTFQTTVHLMHIFRKLVIQKNLGWYMVFCVTVVAAVTA